MLTERATEEKTWSVLNFSFPITRASCVAGVLELLCRFPTPQGICFCAKSHPNLNGTPVSVTTESCVWQGQRLYLFSTGGCLLNSRELLFSQCSLSRTFWKLSSDLAMAFSLLFEGVISTGFSVRRNRALTTAHSPRCECGSPFHTDCVYPHLQQLQTF